MSTYRYTPLDEGKKEIRLITLFAGSFSGNVDIGIHTVSFSSDGNSTLPTFEALSYAWGPASETRHISVTSSVPGDASGTTVLLKVTQNLALALPYLRHKDADRCLWIDAVCINQEDIVERSSQIQLMGDIYSKAQCVLAWLGPEEIRLTQCAVSTLDSLAAKVDIDWATQELKPRSAGLEAWADRSKYLPFDQSEWDAIQSICLCSWFERLWIRQEILLAKKAALIWGESVLPWENFRKAIFCIYNKTRPIQAKIAGDFWERTELLEGLVNNEDSQSLAYAIYSSRGSKCFDPRDRIYAQLGLINEDRNEWNVTPDYSKTVLQVYKDLAIDYYESFLNLGFLRYCDAGFRECGKDLPSWAPDWRCLDAAPPMLPEFSAHGNTSAHLEFDEDILRAHGLSIGSIDRVTEIATDSNQLYHDAVLEFQRCARPHFTNLTGEKLKIQLHALSRVLVADDFGDRSDPPTSTITESQAKIVMEKLWDFTRDDYDSMIGNSLETQLYLNKAQWYCSRRALISTSDGTLGLAPKTTKKDDVVCVFFGCPNPIMMRPVVGRLERFQVIGECYVDSVMRGSAFLGPLGEGLSQILKFDDEVGYHRHAFFDNSTSQSTFVDPRFQYWLGDGFKDYDEEDEEDNNQAKTIEVMKKRGIKLEHFKIE